MTALNPEDVRPKRIAIALLSGGAAALGACLAVTISTPALTRPFTPAVGFCVGLPGAAGFLLALILSIPLGAKRRRARAILAALLGALPWLLVACSPMARHPMAALLGALACVGVASVLAPRGVTAALSAWLLAAAALSLSPEQPGPSGSRSVVILGFDGATWDQIDPMIAAGELPNFDRLRRESATGTLISDEIAQSPRVWTTIATGVHPEVHGIRAFGFNRSYLKAGRIWDEVTARGLHAGVVGWLLNSPPDRALDFTFPGWLSKGRGSTPPAAEFLGDLEKALLYPEQFARRERLKTLAASGLAALAVSDAEGAWRLMSEAVQLTRVRTHSRDADRFWRVMLMVARLKADLFLELVARDQPQFAALVTYPTDSLAHRYWRFHEPELEPHPTAEEIADWGEVVRDAYRLADKTVGRVLARLDLERTTLVITSDHGMQGVPLELRHLLIRGSVLLEAMGMQDQLTTSNNVRNLVLSPTEEGDAAEAALVKVLDLLSSATYEGREDSPFKVVRPKTNPGVVILQMVDDPERDVRIHLSESFVGVPELCYADNFSSDHTVRGVLAIAGPGVLAGARVEAVLQDVATIALHGLELEIPRELEGKLPTAAYVQGWLENAPPRYRDGAMALPEDLIETTEDEVDVQLVEERLRDLGYVE